MTGEELGLACAAHTPTPAKDSAMSDPLCTFRQVVDESVGDKPLM